MSTPYDRVRAHLEGRLSPAEVERLRRELASDPELAAFAEEYRAVHALTAGADRVTRSRLAFEDLALDGEVARRPLRRVAAAALVITLGAATAAFFALRGGPSGPVELAAISLEPVATLPEPAIPPVLASYRPVADGEVQWLDDLDQARAVASATRRPLFVFGIFPGCTICKRIIEVDSHDEGVLALADAYVSVVVDLFAVDPAVREELLEGGYPVLEVRESEGPPLVDFSGDAHAAELRAGLRAGLERRAAGAEPVEWEVAREQARLVVDAREAESERRMGAALDAYVRLAERASSEAFAAAGEAGARRIAAAAREALVAARALAQSDVAGALALLRDGARDFAGTRYEADIERVLERFEATGRFPELAVASD